jgi:hypothetical protein
VRARFDTLDRAREARCGDDVTHRAQVQQAAAKPVGRFRTAAQHVGQTARVYPSAQHGREVRIAPADQRFIVENVGDAQQRRSLGHEGELGRRRKLVHQVDAILG